MIPMLYKRGHVNTTYGRGKLRDIISAEVHEELNGDFSLEFKYPVTGVLYKEMEIGDTIGCYAPLYSDSIDEVRTTFFDIYKIDVSLDGIASYSCLHVSRRFADKIFLGPIVSYYPLTNIISSSYPTGTNIEEFAVTTYGGPSSFPQTEIEPKSVLSALIGEEGSLHAIGGGDISFAVYALDTGNKMVVCYLSSGRGKDDGAQIRYSYNMTGLDSSVDNVDTFNAIIPYWTDSDGNKTFTTNKIVYPSTQISPVKAVAMDCTQAFQTQPTGAELTQYAQDYLDNNTPWLAADTISVDFVNGDIIDTHLPQVNLGDTVSVYWENADVSTKMRVVEYTYDPIAEHYNELTLGRLNQNFVAITGIDGGSGASGASGGFSVPTVYYDTETQTTNGTIDKTLSVSGDGYVIISNSIQSDSTSDTGVVRSLIEKNGTRLAYNQNVMDYARAYPIGSSCSAATTVTNGDSILLSTAGTKNGSKYIYRVILCFGCTVS